jgi:hypothetical protein
MALVALHCECFAGACLPEGEYGAVEAFYHLQHDWADYFVVDVGLLRARAECLGEKEFLFVLLLKLYSF